MGQITARTRERNKLIHKTPIFRRHRCEGCGKIFICSECSNAVNSAKNENWPLYSRGHHIAEWNCIVCDGRK